MVRSDLFCCGYIMNSNIFIWFINPCHSGLRHWGNRIIDCRGANGVIMYGFMKFNTDKPNQNQRNANHDDVIKWKHFPRYWPFVRGIHRSPVNSSHKGQWRGAWTFPLICALNKRLSKQSWGWWFETPLCPLWRHRNTMCIIRRCTGSWLRTLSEIPY